MQLASVEGEAPSGFAGGGGDASPYNRLKTLTIAIGFFKETIRQPVYFSLIIFFSLLILSTGVLTLYGMGEEVRMIREMGISSLTMAGLLITLMAATHVIFEEVRKRTIVTLLSKPVRKWELLIGKFTGILLVILPAYIILSAIFYLTLRWKGGVFGCYNIFQGVLLSFIQVLIIAALSMPFPFLYPYLLMPFTA